MLKPELLLFVLFGGVYGALFHLWQGRSLRDLLTYLLAGMAGFGIGALIGGLVPLNVLKIGRLQVLEASLVSWACLFVARWLKL